MIDIRQVELVGGPADGEVIELAAAMNTVFRFESKDGQVAWYRYSPRTRTALYQPEGDA